MIKYFIKYLTLSLYSLSIISYGLSQEDLSKGQYAVGFKMDWIKNPYLTYSMRDGAEKNNKPVLLGIWYPAKESNNDTVSVLDYINMKGLKGEKELKEQFFKCEVYGWKDNVAKHMFADKSVGKKCYDSLITIKGIAQLNTPPIDSKFPVIIYQHGGGETMVHLFYTRQSVVSFR